MRETASPMPKDDARWTAAATVATTPDDGARHQTTCRTTKTVKHGRCHEHADGDDKIDLNMDELLVLWQSEPIYRGLWIARKDLPDGQFTKIQQAMLQISTSKKAKRYLMN